MITNHSSINLQADPYSNSKYFLFSSDGDDDSEGGRNKISENEWKDVKYLSIFDNTYQDLNKEIMTTDNTTSLNKWKLQWLTGQKRLLLL